MEFGTMEIEDHLRTLFRRCVQCPPEAPSCPNCSSDETCNLKAQSCSQCASTQCVKIGSLPGQTGPTSTPIGAIIGGVIGGVVLVVLVTHLVWRFWIRNRRQEWDKQVWTDQTSLNRSARQSTRSHHSIASTVLTRTSNVIQIAYIPGVINRSPPDSPNPLVPPVPAIPRSTTDNSVASTPNFEQDRHFFMPTDLRDSSYSDLSELDRHSITPSLARTSVATNAVVPPTPAQQALRGKPAVVSVKTGTTTPSGITPSPLNPKNSKTSALANSNSSIVARNLVPRPIQVKKPNSATKVPTLANLQAANRKKTTDSPTSPPTLKHQSEVPTLISESSPIVSPNPATMQIRPRPSFTSTHSSSSSMTGTAVLPASHGRLSDGAAEVESVGPQQRHTESANTLATAGNITAAGLTSMIEEAMNRAARDIVPAGGKDKTKEKPMHGKNDSGPFSDSNEVKENLPKSREQD